jgi:uncharacterized membrane protein YphA (DoxX/SURF4 family)
MKALDRVSDSGCTVVEPPVLMEPLISPASVIVFVDISVTVFVAVAVAVEVAVVVDVAVTVAAPAVVVLVVVTVSVTVFAVHPPSSPASSTTPVPARKSLLDNLFFDSSFN